MVIVTTYAYNISQSFIKAYKNRINKVNLMLYVNWIAVWIKSDVIKK